MDGARRLIERLPRLEFVEGRADRVRGDRRLPLERRTGRGHLGEILDATQSAAGASAHRPATRKMRLQSLAGDRDLEFPTAVGALDFNAADVANAFCDLLGQSKPIGEILQIVWRRHHDGEGCAADDDLYWRFNRDRSG